MFKGKVVTALGAMSGAGLDGVSAAALTTDGGTIIGFGDTAFRPYSEEERAAIQAVSGRGPGLDTSAAAEIVETAHADLLRRFEVGDLVGFDGHTIAHDPAIQSPSQIGDGRVLAEVLGRPVVWDFRSADLELGGQGAPLAPFYHFALAKWLGADQPLAFISLGTVARLTWVDPGFDRPDVPGAVLAFDTGPGTGPLGDLLRARHRLTAGEEIRLAQEGSVDDGVVTRHLADGYFHRMPPKLVGPDTFAGLLAAVAHLPDADAAATLTAVAAISVSVGMEHCPIPPKRLLISGAGRHHLTLMRMLDAALDCPVELVDDVGLDGDMIDAQAIAYLAVRVANGLPTTCPGTTGVRAAVCGGTISRPG
jgi:anhydro-N-acetylmuramic acid kinase